MIFKTKRRVLVSALYVQQPRARLRTLAGKRYHYWRVVYYP